MQTKFVIYFKFHYNNGGFKTLWTTFIHGDGPLLLWALRQGPVSIQRTVRYRDRLDRSNFTAGIILLALSCWGSWDGTVHSDTAWSSCLFIEKRELCVIWFQRSTASLWLKSITCSKTWVEFGFWCIQGWTGITCNHQLPKHMCIACLCEHMREWR
jgi:hypothetical protein